MDKSVIILLNLLCGLTLIGALMLDHEIPGDLHQIEPDDYQMLRKLQSLGLQFSQQFQNITIKDMDIPTSRAPSVQDLQCLADMSLLMQGISSGSLWSLRMIDSWGSIPSGILVLNLVDMGNYGECIKISKSISASHSVQGKYCFAQIPFAKYLGINSSLIRSVNIKIGVCFPASCTAAHMDTFLNKIIQNVLPVNSTASLIAPDTCRTAEREPFDGLTIFTIVLLSLFAAFALLATLFDYFICQDQKQLPALVKIFSVRATSRSLFRLTENRSNPNVIDCLHGLRCMSLVWVVFGHEYMVGMTSPNINQGSLLFWFQKPVADLIEHAHYSVDTFFFLSGLLVIMIALRSMERSKGKLNVPLMYLHRYLRLTPMLALAILVYMKIMPLMVDGPLADGGFDDYSKCERTWFWTLLYMQNYATPDICLAHSWYLGVDMQLYIVSPIFLFALYKWGKKAAIGMAILTLLLSVWLFTVMMVDKYSMFIKNASTAPANSQRVLYFSTHLHSMPWLIGGIFGYFLHANRGKSFKLNGLMVWAGWLTSLAIFFTSIFALYPYEEGAGPTLSTLEESLYYTLTRIGWPLGLCWVVFACIQGYGGMANSFLSSPLWQPLSKLSYSAYVWHLFIQELNVRRVQTNTYFSNYEMMLSFWSDFGFTVLTAYAMYVTVEAPLGGLENLLLPARKPSPKPQVQPVVPEAREISEIPEKTPTSTISATLNSDLEASNSTTNTPALSA